MDSWSQEPGMMLRKTQKPYYVSKLNSLVGMERVRIYTTGAADGADAYEGERAGSFGR
jgi:hypothetical protein